MTRRPFLSGASLVLVAAAAVGCAPDDDPDDPDGGDAGSASTVECQEGIVGEPGEPAESDVRITGYEAQLSIAPSGDLTGAETITVEYDDSEHHGIFRDFDDDLGVANAVGTLDGAPSGRFTTGAGGGRLTLGDPDITLSAGEHVFGVDYVADAVLGPPAGADHDLQLNLAVIEPAWSLDIADATVTIELPDDAGDVSCIAGAGATASITGAGTSTLVVTADEVPAGSGVKVLVGDAAHTYQ